VYELVIGHKQELGKDDLDIDNKGNGSVVEKFVVGFVGGGHVEGSFVVGSVVVVGGGRSGLVLVVVVGEALVLFVLWYVWVLVFSSSGL